MNEDMKQAWLEIAQMLGEPTREELDVFLRAWQRAIKAEREACAKVCDELIAPDVYSDTDVSMWDVTCIDCAAAIRARSKQ